MKINHFALVLLLITISCNNNSQKNVKENLNSKVNHVGAMKNVMRKGKLEGNIYLDSLSNKKHLYGLGPEEFLQSEILILDGKAYQSKVLTDSTLQVSENFKIKAPFFVYSTVSKWKELKSAKTLKDERDLEIFLIEKTKNIDKPFTFKIVAEIDSAWFHIVNLPKGRKVSSPAEAHEGMINYFIENEKVTLIGYFSKKHQRIFTHHDTFMHIHLINDKKTKMGHLENVYFKNRKYKIFMAE